MGIHRTVKALRNTVHGKNISIEELAGLIRAVWGRMTAVVSCLGVAVNSTCRGIVPLSLAEWMILVAHVGILTLSVQGSIDGTREGSGASIASNCRWSRCSVIGIGTSDDNLEASPELPFVRSLSS